MPLQLAFTSLGSLGAGPPLVVLHGLLGSCANWRSIARRLAATRRVISVDLRNHGASPWADSMDYLSMADDVRALIERERLDRAVVMGHSMGGKTAMALALLHPQLVGGLIVVDIAPLSYADTLTPFVEAMRSAGAAAAASRAEVQRRLEQLVPDRSVVPFLMQNLVARNDHFDWRVNLAAIQASMPLLAGFPDELRRLRYDGATHAIAGGRSAYVPRDASAFLPMFPSVELDWIETAGHWVHADRPDEFVAAVQRVLRHDGGQPAQP